MTPVNLSTPSLVKILFFSLALAISVFTIATQLTASDEDKEELVTAEIEVKASLKFDESIIQNQEEVVISSQTSTYKDLSRWGWDTHDTAQSLIFGEKSIYDSLMQRQVEYLATPTISKSIFREVFSARDGWFFNQTNCLAFSYGFTLGTYENEELANITSYTSQPNETLYLFPGFLIGSYQNQSFIKPENFGEIFSKMFYYKMSHKLRESSYENYQEYIEERNITTEGILYLHENVKIKIQFNVEVLPVTEHGCTIEIK